THSEGKVRETTNPTPNTPHPPPMWVPHPFRRKGGRPRTPLPNSASTTDVGAPSFPQKGWETTNPTPNTPHPPPMWVPHPFRRKGGRPRTPLLIPRIPSHCLAQDQDAPHIHSALR